MTTATATVLYDIEHDDTLITVTDDAHLSADDGDTAVSVPVTAQLLRHIAREITAAVAPGDHEWNHDLGVHGELNLNRHGLEIHDGESSVMVDVVTHHGLMVAVMLLDAADELEG